MLFNRVIQTLQAAGGLCCVMVQKRVAMLPCFLAKCISWDRLNLEHWFLIACAGVFGDHPRRLPRLVSWVPIKAPQFPGTAFQFDSVVLLVTYVIYLNYYCWWAMKVNSDVQHSLSLSLFTFFFSLILFVKGRSIEKNPFFGAYYVFQVSMWYLYCLCVYYLKVLQSNF